jgi:hypothetical protein
MNVARSLVSGFGGAVAMTLLHNFLKYRVKDAPRIDELGMQALKKIFGKKIKTERDLYRLSLVSDLLSNGLVYSLTTLARKRPVLAGSLTGIGLGLGTTTLPERLGLKKEFAAGTLKTALMAVSYYLAGGLATGALSRAIR